MLRCWWLLLFAGGLSVSLASAAAEVPSVALLSSTLATNTVAGETASSVEWTTGPGVALLNGGNVTSLNGYPLAVLGGLSTGDTIAVNSNLNVAGQTSAWRGLRFDFSTTAPYLLGKLTVVVTHTNNLGVKQVYSSALNYRLSRLSDNATMAAGSQTFDYAGTGPFFTRVLALAGELAAGTSYRLEVGLNNLSTGGAYAVYDGLTLEGYALPSASPAVAVRPNFAKFQAATASVTSSTYAPEFAVDGIASNYHAWRTPAANGPHWLEVTFPRAVTLGSAQLSSGVLLAMTTQLWQNFRLQYHNGATWVDVPGAIVTGNSDPERTILFGSAVTADRFRLWGSDNGSRSVRELALFPPNPDGSGVEQGFPMGTDVVHDLAHERPVVASSIYDRNYALRAVDGYVHDSSRWLSTSTAAGETLEIDLLTDHALGSAHLHSGFFAGNNNPLASFTLQWWDGAAWQAIPGATVTGNTSLSRAIAFGAPVTTSRVRLLSESASFGRVAALQFFPPRTGGYPLGQNVRFEAPPGAAWEDFGDASHRLRLVAEGSRRLALVDGLAVVGEDATGATALDWQLLLNYRDGSYRLRHLATGLCLGLATVSREANVALVGETYTGLPHQTWFLDYATPTSFRLLNGYSGLALQVAGGSTAVGAAFVTAPPSASAHQRWETIRQTHFPKKGIAASNAIPDPPFTDPTQTWMANAYADMRSASWSYSWGRQLSTAYPYHRPNHVFNPMLWGNFGMAHGSNGGVLELIRNDLHANARPAFLLGYNEPDKEKQSNVPVATAIARWPRLSALDAPLLSPAPASSSTTDGWLVDFMVEADRLGYRVDHTGVHWYANPSADSLISHIQAIYQKWGRPVWLTEFSAVRWSGNAQWTLRDNYNFLAEFMWRAESLPELARYSLFRFREDATGPNQSANDPAEAPRSNALRADGTFTAFGELYAGWDGVTAVVNQKSYHLQNKGLYRRVQNPATTDLVASLSPETAAAGVQWTLIPGTTANTVRIVSTRDGRRLRFFTGTYVGMAPADNLTAQSEWQVVPHEYGWNYLRHVSTNQRLRLDGSGNLVMGSNSATGEDYQWRFAVPMVSEPATAPAAPANLVTTPTTRAIALAWSPTLEALSYTVQRAASAEGTWQAVAQNLASPTYTDSGLADGATWFYRVLAHNNLGASPPSAAKSGKTPTAFENWASSVFTAPQLADVAVSGPLADPNRRGVPNLVAYAVGATPGSFPAEPALRVSPRSDGLLSVVVRRRIGATTVGLRIDASTDLVTWDTTGTALVQDGAPVPTGDGVTEDVTYRTQTPMSGGSRVFLRLSVTLLP